MIPLIPILAIAGIVGGVSALAWYSSLSKSEQVAADRKAMKWFGKRFNELSKSQQNQIKNQM